MSSDNSGNPSPKVKFEVRITEALLWKVARRRAFRRWPLLVTSAILILLGLYPEFQRGELSTFSVAGLTVVGVFCLLFVVYFAQQRKYISDWKRRQGDDPVHYELGMETVRATSNLGSSELRWSVFSALLEHPDFFLLSLGRSAHLTLPRADVPPEAVSFIRERFASHDLPTRRA